MLSSRVRFSECFKMFQNVSNFAKLSSKAAAFLFSLSIALDSGLEKSSQIV